MAKNSFTDAEIVEALRLIAAYSTVAAASRASGIPVSTLKGRRGQAEARGLTEHSHVITDEDKLRGEVRRLKLDVKRLHREADTADTVSERIFKLAARTPQPAKWLSPEHRVGGHKEVPVLMLSDWHWGEVVNPVEVAHVNAFNSEIARQRAELVFDTAITLTERDGPDVPGMVVVLGGDIITGTIHDELAETNDRTTTQAVDEVTDVLIGGLEKLADRFGKLFVPCVVGNHGRNTARWRAKQVVYTSYEWLIYKAIQRHFKNDPRVQMMIPGEPDAFFKINGKRFLLTHGDRLGVKGGDGIIGAIGPIMRGTVKLGTSESQIGRDFDYLMMGHWHYPLYLPRTLVNGALKGFDEYARLILRVPYAPASQLLFRVHPVHGLTSRREIILQEPLKAADGENWVSWPTPL